MTFSGEHMICRDGCNTVGKSSDNHKGCPYTGGKLRTEQVQTGTKFTPAYAGIGMSGRGEALTK
jgi:hypothetical protein